MCACMHVCFYTLIHMQVHMYVCGYTYMDVHVHMEAKGVIPWVLLILRRGENSLSLA